MITTRLAGALVAGSLAIGLAVGTAGTIVAKDTTPSAVAAVCADHMTDMTSMMAGQGGMMNGQANGGSGMMGPGASAMPGWMQQHHMTSSEPAR